MADIEHVIVLMLENRSFDHMLGFLDHPDPSFDGLRGGGPHTNPSWDDSEQVAATPGAKPVLPFDPDHSHDASMDQLAASGAGLANQGFVKSYERKGRGLTVPSYRGLLGPIVTWYLRRRQAGAKPIENRGPLAMLCQPPANVPVLSRLALDFGVCTRWFCSVPGDTWPNRNYLHAATSDGDTETDPRFYTNPTIFELLERAGKTWRIYHDDTPQAWAFVHLWDVPERLGNWFNFSEFADHVAADELPTYSFIEPNHNPLLHLPGGTHMSNSQHPGNNRVPDDEYDGFAADGSLDFTRGEVLIATVYEALRTNPQVFEKSILLITYDEHGGLYDHVPPPRGVADPGTGAANLLTKLIRFLLRRRSRDFDFTMLGGRVPTVVVSPYIKAGAVCADVLEHASVPATLRALFAPDQEPLTKRDELAGRFDTLLTLEDPRRDLPNLSAAARPPTVAAMPPEPAASEPAVRAAVPEHYKDLAVLSEKVRRKLRRQGVQEAGVRLGTPRKERPRRASYAFMNAAARVRADSAPDS